MVKQSPLGRYGIHDFVVYSMPFLIPLIAIVAGILAGSYLENPLWGILPVLAGLTYYLLILRNSGIPTKALKLNSRHSVWIFLLFAGIGILDAWFHRPMSLTDNEINSYVAAEGEVMEIKTLASGDRLLVDVMYLSDSTGNLRDCSNLKIILHTDGISLSVGDVVVFPTKLKELHDNPNFRPTGYSDRMKRKGVIYETRTRTNLIKFKYHRTGISGTSIQWRDRITANIEKSSLERPTINFLIALILGDRSFLSDEVKKTFSSAGVAHILALSGLHVAIISGIILFLLFPLKLLGLHRLRLWIALTALWFYTFFSGLAPSTVRACIMTTFVILAISMQRKNASGNALLASAFTILLFDPSALFDIGMQLSFLCVAGILAFAGQLNTVNRHYHPWLHSAVSAVLVSLVATVSTWVLVSYYFKKIPLLFLPVNLVILPLLPVYMCLALFYLCFLLMGLDIHFAAYLLDIGFNFFNHAADYLSAFGESAISYQVQLPVVILWLLGVMVIGYSLRKDKKIVAGVTGTVMLIGSVMIIPLIKETESDGFIIQKNYRDISVALYDNDTENVAVMPRNSISRLAHKGCEIVSVDCMSNLDSLARIISSRKALKKRYLILGSGFKPESICDIPGAESFDKIIIHSSIKRKIESELLEHAASIGLKKIYSLRQQGPLRVDINE